MTLQVVFYQNWWVIQILNTSYVLPCFQGQILTVSVLNDIEITVKVW